METKSLVTVFLVSCIFLSICLHPVDSQGLRWGREFEEDESPRTRAVKSDYFRRKLNEKKFEKTADKGKQ